MSDFDFFGTEDLIEKERRSPELELSFEFDHENLLTDGSDKNSHLSTGRGFGRTTSSKG